MEFERPSEIKKTASPPAEVNLVSLHAAATRSVHEKTESPVLNPGNRLDYLEVSHALPVPTSQASSYWNSVRNYINKESKQPGEVAARAIENSSVIGFGETTHESIGNTMLQFGIDNMARFKAAGMTHLAVEMPSNLQPILPSLIDNYAQTGELHIPEHLYNADGSVNNSDDANGALTWLHERANTDKTGGPKYFDLLKSAQIRGIRLVAVDDPAAFAPWAHLDPQTNKPPQAEIQRLLGPEMTDQRNRHIVAVVATIVEGKATGSEADGKPAKVGLWAGDFHLGDSHGKKVLPSAGEMIRARLEAQGKHYSSFYGQSTASSEYPYGHWPTMLSLTKDLRRPAAVGTHNQNGTPNLIGSIKVYHAPLSRSEQDLSEFDYVLLFPKDR